jgi:hypothetical protein
MLQRSTCLWFRSVKLQLEISHDRANPSLRVLQNAILQSEVPKLNLLDGVSTARNMSE